MRIATRILALLALAGGLASTPLHYYDGFDASYWQLFTRWDIVTAGVTAILLLTVLVSLAQPGRKGDLGVALTLAFVIVNYAPFAVEYRDGTPPGLIASTAAVVLALVALPLLFVEGAGRAAPTQFGYRPSLAHTGLGSIATPVAAGPAPGWYADPSGAGGERYWDGASWTANVRGTVAGR